VRAADGADLGLRELPGRIALALPEGFDLDGALSLGPGGRLDGHLSRQPRAAEAEAGLNLRPGSCRDDLPSATS
jgi:hypothetical protein